MLNFGAASTGRQRDSTGTDQIAKCVGISSVSGEEKRSKMRFQDQGILPGSIGDQRMQNVSPTGFDVPPSLGATPHAPITVAA
jgi:hypothetical protein